MLIRALSLFKEKVEDLNRVEEFMILKNLYLGADYIWGAENLKECDCSGLICGILTLQGNKIRVNANDIMNLLTDDDNKFYDENKVKLGFFVNPEGIAKHVTILTDNNLLCHASYPNGTTYEGKAATIARYLHKGYVFLVKMLNFDKVDEYTGTIYDLDEELS